MSNLAKSTRCVFLRFAASVALLSSLVGWCSAEPTPELAKGLLQYEDAAEKILSRPETQKVLEEWGCNATMAESDLISRYARSLEMKDFYFAQEILHDIFSAWNCLPLLQRNEISRAFTQSVLISKKLSDADKALVAPIVMLLREITIDMPDYESILWFRRNADAISHYFAETKESRALGLVALVGNDLFELTPKQMALFLRSEAKNEISVPNCRFLELINVGNRLVCPQACNLFLNELKNAGPTERAELLATQHELEQACADYQNARDSIKQSGSVTEGVRQCLIAFTEATPGVLACITDSLVIRTGLGKIPELADIIGSQQEVRTAQSCWLGQDPVELTPEKEARIKEINNEIKELGSSIEATESAIRENSAAANTTEGPESLYFLYEVGEGLRQLEALRQRVEALREERDYIRFRTGNRMCSWDSVDCKDRCGLRSEMLEDLKSCYVDGGPAEERLGPDGPDPWVTYPNPDRDAVSSRALTQLQACFDTLVRQQQRPECQAKRCPEYSSFAPRPIGEDTPLLEDCPCSKVEIDDGGGEPAPRCEFVWQPDPESGRAPQCGPAPHDVDGQSPIEPPDPEVFGVIQTSNGYTEM